MQNYAGLSLSDILMKHLGGLDLSGHATKKELFCGFPNTQFLICHNQYDPVVVNHVAKGLFAIYSNGMELAKKKKYLLKEELVIFFMIYMTFFSGNLLPKTCLMSEFKPGLVSGFSASSPEINVVFTFFIYPFIQCFGSAFVRIRFILGSRIRPNKKPAKNHRKNIILLFYSNRV